MLRCQPRCLRNTLVLCLSLVCSANQELSSHRDVNRDVPSPLRFGARSAVATWVGYVILGIPVRIMIGYTLTYRSPHAVFSCSPFSPRLFASLIMAYFHSSLFGLKDRPF
ncbi:hypothetical protein GGR57DRAFT_484826 [Xylariaceae sp. FL1272]|nr:hypothetical protein GGR57DRAFT_484826 [Xylariaceae sp. FL1272]